MGARTKENSAPSSASTGNAKHIVPYFTFFSFNIIINAFIYLKKKRNFTVRSRLDLLLVNLQNTVKKVAPGNMNNKQLFRLPEINPQENYVTR